MACHLQISHILRPLFPDSHPSMSLNHYITTFTAHHSTFSVQGISSLKAPHESEIVYISVQIPVRRDSEVPTPTMLSVPGLELEKAATLHLFSFLKFSNPILTYQIHVSAHPLPLYSKPNPTVADSPPIHCIANCLHKIFQLLAINQILRWTILCPHPSFKPNTSHEDIRS